MTLGNSNLRVIPPEACDPGGCNWPLLAMKGLWYDGSSAAVDGPKVGGGKFIGMNEFIGIEDGVGVNFLVSGFEIKLPIDFSF
jgi:hypothetical protein